MFCNNCGAELPEGALFCENCGAKVENSENAVNNEGEESTAGTADTGAETVNDTVTEQPAGDENVTESATNQGQNQQFNGAPNQGQYQQFNGAPNQGQYQQFNGAPNQGQYQQFNGAPYQGQPGNGFNGQQFQQTVNQAGQTTKNYFSELFAICKNIFTKPRTEGISYVENGQTKYSIGSMLIYAVLYGLFSFAANWKLTHSFLGYVSGGHKGAYYFGSFMGAFVTGFLISLFLALMFFATKKTEKYDTTFSKSLNASGITSMILIPFTAVGFLLMFLSLPLGYIVYFVGTMWSLAEFVDISDNERRNEKHSLYSGLYIAIYNIVPILISLAIIDNLIKTQIGSSIGSLFNSLSEYGGYGF